MSKLSGFQPRSLLAAFAVLPLAYFATVTPALAQNSGPCCQQTQPSTLNLNVNADSKRAPDMATISVGVVSTARTANAAMAENRRKMSAAMAQIRGAGIEARDIQTSGFSIQPQYEYVENQRPRITGYQVSNNLTVRIRNLELVGPVLDRVVAEGVNQVSGPTFGIDNPEEALDEARREAMETAMRRARIYAEGSGMRIKRVVTINESGGFQPQPPPIMMMRSAMADSAAAQTEIAAGEVTLSIQLNVQFELEPVGPPN
jgi:uncharacterized protein